jgi:menaquinol-cytochrome c reductase iron-sulfur subunit
MNDNKGISRRNFMSLATWAIGGLIGVGMGIPAFIYLLSPGKIIDRNQDWIRLGSISKVELNKPTLFKAIIQKQSGWIVNEEELSVYILTENGRDYAAMSNICTHLGCRVRWVSEEEQFFCPCHTAVFDKNGEVVSGPPPRALDRYEVKIEDDQLFILGG